MPPITPIQPLFVKRLDLALQFDRQRVALAVHFFAYGHLDPAFADAVFLHINALFVVEADADVMLKNGGDMERAAGIAGQMVWELGFCGEGWCGFGHGELFLNVLNKRLFSMIWHLPDLAQMLT